MAPVIDVPGVMDLESVFLPMQRKVPSIAKSDLIVTNIAIPDNKSALSVKKKRKKVAFQSKKCPSEDRSVTTLNYEREKRERKSLKYVFSLNIFLFVWDCD